MPSLYMQAPSTPLRRQLRARRRQLHDSQRHAAAHGVARRVAGLRLFASARRIAAYLAFDGELDPAPLLERAWAMGKRIYLPVLIGNPPVHLLFAPYDADTPMTPNHFGIPEPQAPSGDLLPPQQLDLVLLPLVAFDDRGTRMGMGGGFYDRTFAFLNTPNHLHKPHLLGLAYEVQKVAALERQSWDVPLDGVATEAALYSGDTGFPLD